MDKIAGVLLIGVIVFAFMFRWDIGAGASQSENWLLDRWTGTSYYCLGRRCLDQYISTEP